MWSNLFKKALWTSIPVSKELQFENILVEFQTNHYFLSLQNQPYSIYYIPKGLSSVLFPEMPPSGTCRVSIQHLAFFCFHESFKGCYLLTDHCWEAKRWRGSMLTEPVRNAPWWMISRMIQRWVLICGCLSLNRIMWKRRFCTSLCVQSAALACRCCQFYGP